MLAERLTAIRKVSRKRFHIELSLTVLGLFAAGCFLTTEPGFGLSAARNLSTGRVLMTLDFSSQPRRAMVTP